MTQPGTICIAPITKSKLGWGMSWSQQNGAGGGIALNNNDARTRKIIAINLLQLCKRMQKCMQLPERW